MTCDHDINAREVAVVADGYCPLCMDDEMRKLRAALKALFMLALLSNDINPGSKQMREAGRLIALGEHTP